MNLDFATPKPGVLSFVLITLMAIVGILLAKYMGNKFPGPWTDLLNAV